MAFTIFALVVLSVVLLVNGADPCVPSLKSLSNDQRPSPQSVLSGQIVVPSYNFTCSGVVRSWEATVSGRMLSSFHFQVWQWDSSRRIHRLVGQNVIENFNPEGISLSFRESRSKLVVSVIDPSKQIHVSPGDLIGVFVGHDGDMKMQYIMSSDTVTFSANLARPLEGFVQPLLDPAFNMRLMAAPLIDVSVKAATPSGLATTTSALSPTRSKSLTPAPTQTPDTGGNKAGSNPLPYALIAGVAISGAVLVGVCIGLIVAVLCYVQAKKQNRNTQNYPDNSTEKQSRLATLLHSLDTPRRNLLAAFKRQESVQGSPNVNARGRPVVEVDLSATNAQLTEASGLELSYAYPITQRPSFETRSTSSTLPSRKPSSRAHIPLPEIPKEIELRQNPSYSALSTESLNEPDRGEPMTGSMDEELYDLPVFSQQSSPPEAYEIPVSSLSSPTDLTQGCSTHLYESTEDMTLD